MFMDPLAEPDTDAPVQVLITAAQAYPAMKRAFLDARI
jgi:hypothetical protein